MRDVSERHRLETDLRQLATTDSLTGLFNRQAFMGMLQERLPRGAACVLFVDLDRFKSINDTLGHARGDEMLREVANVLRHELRPGDIAARLGGDEFTILPAVRSLAGSCSLAARLIEHLSRLSPMPHRRLSASIGVATGHHISAETLLQRADLAMYEAKSAGGSQYAVSRAGQPGQLLHAQATEEPA